MRTNKILLSLAISWAVFCCREGFAQLPPVPDVFTGIYVHPFVNGMKQFGTPLFLITSASPPPAAYDQFLYVGHKRRVPADILVFVIPNGSGGFYALAYFFPGASGVAQSTSHVNNNAAAFLNPVAPQQETLTVPMSDVEYALQALERVKRTHAGVDSSKKIVAKSDDDDWFSDPVTYSNYQYSRQQNNGDPGVGLDGDQNGGTVGLDFISKWKTIVGCNFTYTNRDLNSYGTETGNGTGIVSAPTTHFNDSANSYFISSYIAKNFSDWVNIGGSLTYGHSDIVYRDSAPAGVESFNFDPDLIFSLNIPAAAFSQGTHEDTVGLSPFVGISHTFGAISFSSTPTYIWQYNHYTFGTPHTQYGDLPAPSATRTISSTFLWLNNVEYALTDKITLSARFDWTRVVSAAQLTYGGTVPVSNDWVTIGPGVTYQFNPQGKVNLEFGHDVFSRTSDDYHIKTGVTYAF